MLASFFCGIPLLRSKNSTVSNSLPAVGPVPLAPYAAIAHCAASPHPRIPFGELPRPDLYRISKAVYKNWRHSESFGTNNMPPSLWSVKETKNPLESLFKLFEGVPFFLSIYWIGIRPNSIKNRGDAQQLGRHTEAVNGQCFV